MGRPQTVHIAMLAFVTLDWRSRWSRVTALFGTDEAR